MQFALTLALLTVLAIAIRTDILAHRIPNALTGIGACAGLLLQTLHAGTPALLLSLGGIAAGVGVMLPFYLLRGMGAGDVKLMGTVGSFVGPQAVLLAGGATLVVGAVIGIGVVAGHFLSRRSAIPELQTVTSPSIRKEKFPYAVAIAGGTLVSLTHFGQLAALTGVFYR